MVVGTLAITGVGIDVGGGTRLCRLLVEGRDHSRAPGRAARVSGTIAFWIGSLAALLTSFYSWRLIFLTFFGEPRWAASEHIQHALHGDHADHPDEEHGDSAHDPHHVATGTGGYHPHESPLTILVPIVLARPSALLAAGQVFHGIFIDAERAPTFWHGTVAFSRELAEAAESSALWVKLTPTIAMLLGLWIAWNNYIRSPGAADRFVGDLPGRLQVRRQQMVFRRAVRLPVRPAGAVARPAVLAWR